MIAQAAINTKKNMQDFEVLAHLPNAILFSMREENSQLVLLFFELATN